MYVDRSLYVGIILKVLHCLDEFICAAKNHTDTLIFMIFYRSSIISDVLTDTVSLLVQTQLPLRRGRLLSLGSVDSRKNLLCFQYCLYSLSSSLLYPQPHPCDRS